MASLKEPCWFLLLAILTLSSSIINAIDCPDRGAISVYWGQKGKAEEGTLKKTCDTGNYNIVILESLLVFDDGSIDALNLADHCGSGSDTPCTVLEPEIKHCQDKGIQVFLSIGLDEKAPSPPPENSEKKLAENLWNKFLRGTQSGPLGSVALDGIDIADVADDAHLHWGKLVEAINAFSTPKRKIYLSASPQCVYPDRILNSAIQTGLFDYIWVEFFFHNPSCIYNSVEESATSLLEAWKTWTSNVPKSKIFLGLTASTEIQGFIPPNQLKNKVLPDAKKALNYGGVMIWDRSSDRKNKYSHEIKNDIGKKCRCVCNDVSASANSYGLGSLAL